VRHHLRSERLRWAAWIKLPAEPPDDGEIDAGRLDALRAAPAIQGAISSLSAADRETFLLFALGELSYGEVGEALGVPIGTVRSRIFRVRKILRELLREPEATTRGVTEPRNTAEGHDPT
jgi:RNA polymerase sigma factor (sigma-70 family)